MKSELDDDLSFALNIWDKMIYKNINEFKLDIYYNEGGYPSIIHCLYGANAVPDFKLALVNEILARNNTDDIWCVWFVEFAIISKASNCDGFEMDYRGHKFNILKKTIEINSIK